MEPRTSPFAVGLFFIIAFALLIAVIVGLLGQKSGFRSTKTYVVYFSGSVSGLREGSLVRYRGVPVGSVTRMEIDQHDPEKIAVFLSINDKTPITDGTLASLEMQGITGTSYVQMSGGHKDSPRLVAQQGQKYPVIASKNSRLEELIDNAPGVLKNTSDLLQAAERFLSPQNQQEVSRMFKNLADITETLSSSRQDVELILKNGRSILAHVKTVVADVESLTKSAQAALVDIHEILKENRAAVHNFTGIGLDQLTKLVSETRAGVLGLNRIIDRVERSPSRFLFGDQEQGVTAR